MKNNKTLVTIILVAIVSFSALIFSVYKIISNKKEIFYADGYVSISDSENSKKIYFDEGTTYKKGYHEQIIFENKDNQKTEASRYSFAFYDNKSITFLADGVILDLNGINNSFIPYYNIKSNYLIEYTGNKYVIHSNNEDVILDNFIGRINEQKYIVVGNNIKLKTTNSDDFVNSDYFEINFIDGKTIKIDGRNFDIETINDNAYILVNDNIKIDLNNQTILIGDEEKLHLNEIIIDNDSNIDINYEDITKLESDNDKENSNESGSGNGQNPSGQTDKQNSGVKDNKDKKVETKYEVETVTDYKKVPYLEILSSVVTSKKISLEFNVIDEFGLINGPINVSYKKLNDSSSEIKNVSYTGKSNIKFVADNLTSDSSYLITITTSYIKDGNVFGGYVLFQRTFETNDIGVALERDYITNDSIYYNIVSAPDSSYVTGKLNVYDSNNSLIFSKEFDNNKSFQVIGVQGLSSNTKYTAKIEDLTFGAVTYLEQYATRTDVTLKYNPFKDAFIENQPQAIVNKKDNTFKIDIGKINDKDISIQNVQYIIKEIDNEGNRKEVRKINKENTNAFTLPFEDPVSKHNNYYYETYITLNDNEKTEEYRLFDSNSFRLDAKQSPTMQFITNNVSTHTINGIIKVTDTDNTISGSTYIKYTDTKGNSNELDITLDHENCPTEESASVLCANLNLTDLKSNDVYTISLIGDVDINDEEIEIEEQLIGSIKVNTTEALIVNANMEYYDLMSEPDAERTEVLAKLYEDLFEVKLGFYVDLTTEENQAIMNNMNYFEAYLYEGNYVNNAPIGHMIVDSNSYIVNKYFDQTAINPDKEFVPATLTIKDFGLTVDELRTMHLAQGYQILPTYTITLNNALSGGNEVEFQPTNYITFDIDPELISLTSNYASVTMDEILNNKETAGDHYNEELDETTTIGLRLSPEYDNEKYATGINYKIFDVTDPNNKTSKEIYFSLNNLALGEAPTLQIFFDDETYIDKDTGINFFRRGRKYVAEMTVNLNLDSDASTTELIFPGSAENITVPEPAVSETLAVKKQLPKINLFAFSSGLDSQTGNQYINYKYEVANDVDSSLKDHDKVYYQMDTEQPSSIIESQNITCATSNDYKCFKILGLNNDDRYSIIFRPQLIEKTEEYTTDLVINKYAYEGYLDDLMIKYDLLQGENGNKYNNLFVIGLSDYEQMTSTGLLNRVAYYHAIIEGESESIDINFITDATDTAKVKTDKGDYTKVNNLAYISTCEEYDKCLYIDYSVLYNNETVGSIFKKLQNKPLKLYISSIYDDGKVGYDATKEKYYAFQIKYPLSIENKDKDNNYLLLKNGIINYQSINDLTGAYVYSPITDAGLNYYGFVDDGNDKLSLKSAINGNSITIDNYKFTKDGIIYNSVYPIVAKELKESLPKEDTDYKSIFDTSYFTIVPSLNVKQGLASTFDGIKTKIVLTGLENTNNDGKVYFEFFDEEGAIVGNAKAVDSDIIINNKQTVVKSGNKYHLNFDKNNYYLDITTVTDAQTGELIDSSNYYYDYPNGDIYFDDETISNNIIVDYRIAFNNLGSNKKYTMKAYIMVADKKIYLADSKSGNYSNLEHTFTTSSIKQDSISEPKMEIVSYDDYSGREITISYNITDIIGIKILTYEITNSLSENYNIIDYIPYSQNDCYYKDDMNTCFIKTDKGYEAKVKFKVSNTDDKFIYDEDYQITIANIGDESTSIKAHIRALENPVIKVEKLSYRQASKYYLKFVSNISDPDRVIKDGLFNEYIKEFANGQENEVTGYPNEIQKKISEYANNIVSSTYGDGKLNKSTAYNWYIKYKTYINNKGNPLIETDYLEPYLNYTLNDYGIAVGKYEFKISEQEDGKSTSMLRFGYATNFIEDIEDSTQEAYVAGIQYIIYSGDTIPGFNSTTGTILFKDYEPEICPNGVICDSHNIMYTSAEDSILKSNYYQISINTDNVYPQEITAMYDITAHFYVRGKITENLNSSQACYEDNEFNIWVNTSETTGDCYKYTSDLQVNSNTQYKGGAK